MGGADKALLDLAGRPLLGSLAAALWPEVAALAISANGDPDRFASFGLPVLADGALAGEGPLAGLLAGLDWAAMLGAEALLTVPGDTPFLPPGLAARLAPAPAWARRAGRLHPLVALWPIACAEALAGMLAASHGRAVRDFGARIGMRPVDFSPDGEDPFFNINTEADLAAARVRAGG
jgi:molybdopterin-guanine dinucleotide biosynthesis protein A